MLITKQYLYNLVAGFLKSVPDQKNQTRAFGTLAAIPHHCQRQNSEKSRSITWNEERFRLSCVKDKLKKTGPLPKYGTL